MACSLGASAEALCAGATVGGTAANPAATPVGLAAPSGLATAASRARNALLATFSVAAGGRSFNSFSSSVTRTSKLWTTSRSCFTSSAEAGAASFDCARPAGHHAINATQIPIAYQREILLFAIFQVDPFRVSVRRLFEVCFDMGRPLSRLGRIDSNRVVAPEF